MNIHNNTNFNSLAKTNTFLLTQWGFYLVGWLYSVSLCRGSGDAAMDP